MTGLAIGSAIGGLITLFLVAFLHAAAPKSDEERAREDEAQMRSLLESAAYEEHA